MKKVFNAINFVSGVLFPCILFIMLFGSFVITIFFRYIFHKSVTWGNEVAILCYIWIMFFGCGKAIENDENVVFSLVYDVVPPKGKMIFKIIYNSVLVLLMLICVQPCLRAWTNSSQITGVLKLPYQVAFGPFFWMMLNILVFSALNIKKAIAEYREDKNKPFSPDNAAKEIEKQEVVI